MTILNKNKNFTFDKYIIFSRYGVGQGYGRGRPNHSMERGRRGGGSWGSGGLSPRSSHGGGGYSDTEMLEERQYDRDTYMQMHR